MIPAPDASVVPGWVGGFAQTNPAFAYPTPDLSALPLLDNMANIGLLQRQQGVEWPEFSWETAPGSTDPGRCFQLFAPYISRIGYTDAGRIYSIICPQQGIWLPDVGCLNVEISVTGQRGWVDETSRTLAADMTVEGKIWFSPSANDTPFVKLLWHLFAACRLPFPADKARAIRVTTHRPGHPAQPVFSLRAGESPLFVSPAFARHPAAWTVGNIAVEIGPVLPTDSQLVNDFNQLILDVFNLASGNMLRAGNLLAWNLWLAAPGLVNQQEWQAHAEQWRDSIDADHGSPTGPGTSARYADGTLFNPEKEVLNAKLQEVIGWVTHNFLSLCRQG